MYGKRKHVVVRCDEGDGVHTWDVYRRGKVVQQGIRTRSIALGVAVHLDFEELLEEVVHENPL